jgi:hypothetical protein
MNVTTLYDRFFLVKDGDRHEEKLWPLVSPDFAIFEAVLRILVVPQTERVCKGCHGKMLRSGLPNGTELAVMGHYSTL